MIIRTGLLGTFSSSLKDLLEGSFVTFSLLSASMRITTEVFIFFDVMDNASRLYDISLLIVLKTIHQTVIGFGCSSAERYRSLDAEFLTMAKK